MFERMCTSIRARSALVCACLAVAAGTARADTVLFSETDFDPGSWNAHNPFLAEPDIANLSYGAVTDRFFVDVNEKVLITQFSLDVPANEFTSVYAPVFYNGFSHDPGTDGQILNISASVRTFPAAAQHPTGGFGVMRMWLLQDGKYYILSAQSDNFATNYPEFAGHQVADPELIRNANMVVQSDFIEVIPGVGFDFNSQPDFTGSPISFGMGYSMTSTGLSDYGQTTIVAGFDDVNFRIQVIPEPATVTMLAMAGLPLLRRHRRHRA